MADQTEEGAREEAEAVIYGAVQEVLDKTGVSPKDIDILIINCSLFSPTPSLCAMVIHHFQMRSDVLSYNLSGMGCSAGACNDDDVHVHVFVYLCICIYVYVFTMCIRVCIRIYV